MQQTEFFVSLGHFLPFYFPNNFENQNFEVKRVSGDVIILHKWTIDDNHMMYGSWDEVQQTECFVILGHFLPFYFHNNPENQNFEKVKKASGDVIILHICITSENHMYCSWDMKCDRQNLCNRLFCHFGPLFALWSH